MKMSKEQRALKKEIEENLIGIKVIGNLMPDLHKRSAYLRGMAEIDIALFYRDSIDDFIARQMVQLLPYMLPFYYIAVGAVGMFDLVLGFLPRLVDAKIRRLAMPRKKETSMKDVIALQMSYIERMVGIMDTAIQRLDALEKEVAPKVTIELPDKMFQDMLQANSYKIAPGEQKPIKIQTKRMSLVESGINIVVGIGVSIGAQVLVFPLFGIHIGLSQNLGIALFFTAVSLARSYVLRRVFNAISEIDLEKKQGEK